MLAQSESTGTRAAQRGPARPSINLRSLIALDERTALVRLAMTVPGRCLLFALFFALLQLVTPARMALVVCTGAAFAAFLPHRRELVLFVATLAALLLNPVWHNDNGFADMLLRQVGPTLVSLRNQQRILTVVWLALWALVLLLVRKRPKSLLAMRPLLCQLGVLVLASALALFALKPGLPWLWLVLCIKLSAAYLWFASYAVVDQRAPKRPSLAFSMATFRPFWGSYSAPIGKSASYLSRAQCKSAEELAVTQLKGLKLLTWSFVLMGLSRWLIYCSARLGVPPLEALLQAFGQGQVISIAAGWVALVIATATTALELAAWGHQCVAGARLAGIKLKRNTVRPLSARSLADFWNRYYFYFKELLVDFFFYPTFFRFFKRQPKLRVFFATFVAAGIGNALFHFLRDIELLFTLGPRRAIAGYTSYIFYCTVLALGIGISQVRAGDKPASAPSSFTQRAWSVLCIWGFFVCLHPFGGVESRVYPFTMRLAFMAHQLGIPT